MSEWIEFRGGECPAPVTAVVDIKFGDGLRIRRLATEVSWDSFWRKCGEKGMFYSVVKDCTPNEKGWIARGEDRLPVGVLLDAQTSSGEILRRITADELLSQREVNAYRVVKEADAHTPEATTTASETSGWIEWRGGLPPLADDVFVQVKYRRGRVSALGNVRNWVWAHHGRGYDIVAYRVVKEATTPEPQERASAPKLLNKAAALMEERGKQYDQPQGERSMGRAVAALNVVLGRQALTESEGWLLLQLLKDVRDRQRAAPHVDSLEDGVAYAALKAEARLAEGGKDV